MGLFLELAINMELSQKSKELNYRIESRSNVINSFFGFANARNQPALN